MLGATLFMEIEGAGNTGPRALRLTYSSDWLLIWHFLASKNIPKLGRSNVSPKFSVDSQHPIWFQPIQIVSGPRWSSCGAWRTAHHPVGHLRPLLPPGHWNPERSGPSMAWRGSRVQKKISNHLSHYLTILRTFPYLFHIFSISFPLIQWLMTSMVAIIDHIPNGWVMFNGDI